MTPNIFEETIQQITKVQIWIGKYNLKQTQLRNQIPDFIPNSQYFQLRNHYEGLRINKLSLRKRKNNLISCINQN